MKFSDFKNNINLTENSSSNSSETSDKIKNLEVILDIVKSINRSLILDDVLPLVLSNAIKLTNSERGFIVLKDSNESHELEYKLGLDSSGNTLDKNHFEVSTTVVQDVFSTGQSIFIEGAQSDTNSDPSKSILKLELQTILCSPLITGDKKIGVIYVDSKYLHKIKIKEITDTFEILAGQAATAIWNAQLYNGQVKAYNALQEANTQLIQAERKALKFSINTEIGQSLQGLVHLALLETESMMRTIEKAQKDHEQKQLPGAPVLLDRLVLKNKVAIDSIRNIQKYAQALLETSVINLNKNSGDINTTIQSVIKYLSPMKKFSKVIFKTEFNQLPLCTFDTEQIQHLLVSLFSNSAGAKADVTISVKSVNDKDRITIKVEDNGPGIPHDKVKTLFEPPSSGKTGYGLFLCKSIIDRHNGTIEVIEKNKGVLIQFSLPVNNG